MSAGGDVAAGGPRVIAVASGKGGTGKTLLAANVAIYLATLRSRVVVVDAAFGTPNLHTFVGVDHPARTLGDMLGKATASLADVVVPTPVAELGLVAGEADPAWAANPKSPQMNRLLAGLRSLPADFVVVDLGTGTGATVLEPWLHADLSIVVMTPEPPSVELAYRLIKAAFLRRLHRAGIPLEIGYDDMRACEGGLPAPIDVWWRAHAQDPTRAEKILAEMRRLRPRLVVNKARAKADMDLGFALAPAARRRLGVAIDFLGYLEYDDAAWAASRRRRPLLVEHPESRIAKCFDRVVRRLLSRDGERAPPDPLAGESYYDLLDVEPSATDEEIRRGNRRVREVYARDSIVVGGLYGREGLDELWLRLDVAYETLMDPTARKDYDEALFPLGVPAHRRKRDGRETPVQLAETMVAPAGEAPAEAGAEPVPAPPLPPAPDVGPDTEYTGDLLRRMREARGIHLREVSEQTKVGVGYLTAIEAENWRRLPAVVYVRGFLNLYARALHLDADRVLVTYMARLQAARAQLDLDGTG